MVLKTQSFYFLWLEFDACLNARQIQWWTLAITFVNLIKLVLVDSDKMSPMIHNSDVYKFSV